MIKYTVLTFLFGDYDTFKEPEEVDENATYVCVTDRKDLTSKVWNIIYEPALDTNAFTNIQKSFYVKYYGLWNYIAKDSEFVVRLDASIQIHKSLRPIIEYMYKNDYDCLLQYHNSRTDVIDEYNAWIRERQGYNPEYKDIFIRKMCELGYDINMSGLLGTTIQIYHIAPNVIQFVKDANDIINQTSNYQDNNDQCYYTYALYKNFHNLNILFTNTQIIASDYMDYCYHGSDEVVFKNHFASEGFNLSKKVIKPLFDTFIEIHYF